MFLRSENFYQLTMKIVLFLLLLNVYLNVKSESNNPNITIEPEHDLMKLTYTNNTYYSSTFIGLPSFFKEHWKNIERMPFVIHKNLSTSHRRAITVSLGFKFPFYGQRLRNVTITTGGFMYTGDHVHNWLAATQYIAPLMANFDTSLKNNSLVKIVEDDTNFTVVWENVCLKDNKLNPFTFAVTLRQYGDIIFAYKDIPIDIKSINDHEHPVKIGISDAYMQDRVIFYKKRKTIYEYHHVKLLNYNITSGTIFMLHPLPTCPLYYNCQKCTNHKTSFPCSWCEAAGRCSHGTDRQQQDWMFKNCDKMSITKESDCPGDYHGTTGTTSVDDVLPAFLNDVKQKMLWWRYGSAPHSPSHSQRPPANSAARVV